LDVKAASHQRRTLSFKEGLQEIKKTWGLTSGQAPEEKPQPAADDRRARPPRAEAKGERAKDPQRPKGQQRPRTAGAKPQQQAGHGKQGGKPGEKPAQQPKQAAQHQPSRQQQHRARPAKPLPANLSDEERARIERTRQLNTVWNVLAKHYPTFRERLPLKIGVIDDLCTRHPDLERTLLVSVLKRHVNHPRYHERVAAGGPRYELDGTASEGPGIEPSHIARANAALARQKAKAEARAREAAQPQNAGQPKPEAAAPADAPAAAVPADAPVTENATAAPPASEA
jgi:sRNA-binding protein